MKKLGIKIIYLATALYLTFNPLTTLAFSINPAKFIINIGKGEEQILKLTVTNTEKENTVFVLDTLGALQDENGRPKFGKGLDEAEKWIKIETPFLEIAPGAQKNAIFTIKAPANAGAGLSHYLGLAVSPATGKNYKVGAVSQAVSLLEVVVAGTAYESVILKQWRPSNWQINSANWVFNLKLENTGTVAVPLNGSLQVTNWQGQTVYQQPIYLGNNLAAHATRVLKPAINKINLLPGFYGVKLHMVYGKTGQVLDAYAAVSYFSTASLVIIGVVVLVLLGLIFLLKKRGAQHKNL